MILPHHQCRSASQVATNGCEVERRDSSNKALKKSKLNKQINTPGWKWDKQATDVCRKRECQMLSGNVFVGGPNWNRYHDIQRPRVVCIIGGWNLRNVQCRWFPRTVSGKRNALHLFAQKLARLWVGICDEPRSTYRVWKNSCSRLVHRWLWAGPFSSDRLRFIVERLRGWRIRYPHSLLENV